MGTSGISGAGVKTVFDYARYSDNRDGAESQDTSVDLPDSKQDWNAQFTQLVKEKLENSKNSAQNKNSNTFPDKNMTDEEWKKFLNNVDRAIELNKEEVKQHAEEAVKKADREKEETEQYQEEDTESKTATEVIVKPDGSKVLMITMDVGGVKSTMSIEIAKPSEFAGNADENEHVQKEEECLEPSAGEVLTGNVLDIYEA